MVLDNIVLLLISPVFRQDSGLFLYSAIRKMLPCLRRVLRPAFSLTAGRGLSRDGHRSNQTPAVGSGYPRMLASQPPLSGLVQRCYLGTHPLNEPVEPLNSPRGAKDFIYSLHPSERSCLLRELHKFESIAIAQGRWCFTVKHTVHGATSHNTVTVIKSALWVRSFVLHLSATVREISEIMTL